MTSPATSHLGRLIDEYLRRHSASIGGLADRIGISRQALRQWRVGEIRSLPTQQNLKSAAVQIGCSYEQILDAAYTMPAIWTAIMPPPPIQLLGPLAQRSFIT